MLIFLMGLTTLSQAQTRKYSNEFLSIGVGARALGMSGANVASVTDVTAGFWNPANLVDIKADLEIAGMHAEYFAGIAQYDYGAIAKPIDSTSVLALSVIRFGVDGIPNTTQLIDADGNLNYDRISTFSAVDYGFVLSYAKKLKVPGLSVGGNVKVVHRFIGDFAKSWGFGIDLAATYRLKNWRFSAMGRDLTTTYNAWTYSLDDATKDVFVATGNELPENGLEITLPKIVLGAAYKKELNKFALLGEVNAVISTDGQRNVLLSADPISVEPLIGLEASYINLIYLRAGLGNMQRIKTFRGTEEISIQPNLGVGLRLGNFHLDYAITNIGNVSNTLYSNIFSLKFQVFKAPGS
ncbi:PorV/PorQ family protein [Cryomorpha ignava]|uniref:PorV/PorQ family protein n=2 Tax=Cryomorpha ignava TaxID=101383 RepID=A0A7K3WTW2_9FLAO|nr:PorV/PorQ family protein [Cryomorpha ignava]